MLKKLQRLTRLAGLDIRRSKNTSLLNLTDRIVTNPRELKFKSHKNGTLIKVPIEKCLYFGPIGLPVSGKLSSPFNLVIEEYEKKGILNYDDSYLKYYYNNFKPRNAEEVMGFYPEGSYLSDYKSIAALFPWLNRTPNEQIEYVRNWLSKDNKEHGFDSSEDEDIHLWGPTSKQKGQIEIERLINVYESIKKNGFKYSIHDGGVVGATFLLWGNDWRIITTGGQHRMACLSSLGYKEAILKIKDNAIDKFIDKNDINYWPLIKNNYITYKQGRSYLERIFDGELPPKMIKNVNRLCLKI